MCDKAVDNYPHALKAFSDCYITQKMCDKALSILILLQYNLFLNAIRLKKCVTKLSIDVFFVNAFVSIPDRYKTQKICDRVVSEDLF